MRSHVRVFLSLLAVLIVAPLRGQSPTLVFNAALTGANVVGSTGSASGFASATLLINGDQATLDVTTLGVSNITDIALYQASAGTSGSLVQTFTDANFFAINGRFHRTMPLELGVASAIAANPENYYLAVATTQNPSGALRGQLSGANTTYLAGTIAGSNPICEGTAAIPNAAGSFVFAVTPDPGGLTDTVRYDLVTRGLGGAITALQIGFVKTGPALFTLGNATSADGHFVGAIHITAGNARLLHTLPPSTRFTVTTPATGIECAAAGLVFYAHEVFIPVAGTVRGIGNSNYLTDLNLFNNSSAGTTADILTQYFPSGGSTATAAATSWSTVLPRNTKVSRDLSATLFNGITGVGALRVISADNVFANARIYNSSSSSTGTFGQFVPGLPRTFAMNEGTLIGLANIVSGTSAITGSGNARTNIGFFNPSETATTIALEMRDSTGVLVGQRQLTLMPSMQLQMPLTGTNGLFNNVSGDTAASAVYFLSGAPVFVYASVVDNASGDASYVTASASSGL